MTDDEIYEDRKLHTDLPGGRAAKSFKAKLKLMTDDEIKALIALGKKATSVNTFSILHGQYEKYAAMCIEATPILAAEVLELRLDYVESQKAMRIQADAILELMAILRELDAKLTQMKEQILEAE